MNKAKAYVALLITVGYIALTMTSLIKWNEATSSALILGFAVFAKDALNHFLDVGETQTRTKETT